MTMLLENSWGNSNKTLRKHLKHIQTELGFKIKKLGVRRFQQIRQLLEPSVSELKELTDMLVKGSQRYDCGLIILMMFSLIEDVFIIVIDEGLLGYQPSGKTKAAADRKGEPIPVVYIERKPHPNGLEVWPACSYIVHPSRPNSKVPFIVDFIPKLTVSDTSSPSIVQQIMQRYEILVCH
jgi:hypothetical protein